MINLSLREKRLLMLLSTVIVAGVFYFFIIKPVTDFKRQSDSSYELKIGRAHD